MRVTRARLCGVAGAGLLAASTAPGAVSAAPRALLPNLVPLRPLAVYVGGVAPVTDRGNTVFPCQPGEVANDRPTPARCLRFETRAANVGNGPLELRNAVSEAVAAKRVMQRVYASDGSFRDSDAGTLVLDPAHAHFHYDDFAVANLWRSDARGRRLGRTPLRAGDKAGFCLMDVYQYRPGASRTYDSTEACYPTHVTEDNRDVAQVSGISAGWVDVYDATVPHQYIEVSGVPDGYYLLEIVLDPLRRLRERTTRDNAITTRIRLCGDRVDIVGRTTHCS